MIYYLTTDDDWQQRRDEPVVATPGPAGFVHCCDERQVAAVRAKYFPAETPVVALTLDPTRMESETRYEPGSAGGSERFPHVYGAINASEVVATETVTVS